MEIGDGLWRVGDERKTATEGVIERSSKTVDVRSRVGRCSAKQFGSQILRCSKEFRTAVFMQFRNFASQSEIGELGMTVCRHHDIVRFDIAMDNLLFFPCVF